MRNAFIQNVRTPLSSTRSDAMLKTAKADQGFSSQLESEMSMLSLQSPTRLITEERPLVGQKVFTSEDFSDLHQLPTQLLGSRTYGNYLPL